MIQVLDSWAGFDHAFSGLPRLSVIAAAIFKLFNNSLLSELDSLLAEPVVRVLYDLAASNLGAAGVINLQPSTNNGLISVDVLLDILDD